MTCKSTSAGAIQLGSHTIETWSVNQQVVSLSSAESEFYAIGSGCARGLTIKHVLLEILHTTTPDADIKMTVCTDSDAARGMIHRAGCGRVRHFQTRYLWHQQAMREGHFVVTRCGTKENPSDLGTKIPGEGGNDKLHEQACNCPYICFEKCHRSGSHVGEWCQQSDNCSHQDGLLCEGQREFYGQDERDQVTSRARDWYRGRRSCCCDNTALVCSHEQVWRLLRADA